MTAGVIAALLGAGRGPRLARRRRAEGRGHEPEQPAQALRRRGRRASTSSRRGPAAATGASAAAARGRVHRPDRLDHADRRRRQQRVVTGLWSGARTDGDAGAGARRRARPRPHATTCCCRTGRSRRRAATTSAPTARRRRPGLDARRQGQPGGDREPRRVRGEAQPGPWRRAGREARQPADRQQPVRVRPVPRRLRGRRRRRQRPALDRARRATSPCSRSSRTPGEADEGARRADGRPVADVDPVPVGAEQRRRRARRRALRRRAHRLAVRARKRARLARRARARGRRSTRPGSRTSPTSSSTARTCSCSRWPRTGCSTRARPAALIRVAPDGTRTVLAQRGARRADGRRRLRRLDLRLEPRHVAGSGPTEIVRLPARAYGLR